MIKTIALIVMILGSLAIGYGLGQRQTRQQPTDITASERKPLYYRHPMNPTVTSPTPAKDDMGMDYLAVYSEDLNPTPATSPARKILYYRHPMGAADTSPVPKKDEMGMDYLPVFATEAANSGQIQLSPEKIQKLGVSTETLIMRNLTRSINALGSIQIDERSIHAVTPKFEGWIQRLYVNSTGQTVKRGQALLEIYSPDLMTAQQEYLIAKQGQLALEHSDAQTRNTEAHLVDNALLRLHYWDIAPSQIQRLQNQGTVLQTLPLLSPVNGVVLDKPAVEGMRFMPGETLFRIADLSTVWLLADVYEQDIAAVQLGQAVQAHISAYPDRIFSGKVGFVYPTLSTETRTVKVRIELANNEGLLKPGLYGSVTLATQADKALHLAVPDSAVIDSGTRQIVLLNKGVGHFEPRLVKLGRQTDGYWEVLAGLTNGDEVVIRANFLLDAESNLKSALRSFDSVASGVDSKGMHQLAPETENGEH